MPEAHSNLRADDWRSPLVRRLIGCDNYADGSTTITGSDLPRETKPGESRNSDLRSGPQGRLAALTSLYNTA